MTLSRIILIVFCIYVSGMLCLNATAIEVVPEYTKELPSADSLKPSESSKYSAEIVNSGFVKDGDRMQPIRILDYHRTAGKWNESLADIQTVPLYSSEDIVKLNERSRYQQAELTKKYAERIASILKARLIRHNVDVLADSNQISIRVAIIGLGITGFNTWDKSYIDVLKYGVFLDGKELFSGFYRQSNLSKSLMSVGRTPKDEVQIAEIVSREILRKLRKSQKGK